MGRTALRHMRMIDTAEPRNVVYWWETEPVVPGPALDGDKRADVCIVGGGYTGMWTALLLKEAEPELNVVVLEADWAGCGASGHNDGFAGTQLERSLHQLVDRLGVSGASAVHEALAESAAEIGEFCRCHGIDAEYEPAGYLSIATNDGQRRRLERELEAVRAMGGEEHFSFYDSDRAREILSSPVVVAALKDKRRALLNPHKLARGLARIVRKSGIDLFERSPVVRIEKGSVGTPRGVVKTPTTVVATNAYQHRFRHFKRTVTALWSYSTVSEPLSDDQLGRVRWPGREGFEDERNYTTICRLTRDNRVLWAGRRALYFYGNGMGERHRSDRRAFAELAAAWAEFFPMWKDVRFTHAYGGCVGVTRSFLPYVGTLGDGIYYAYGYAGHGVSPSRTVAKALRDLILHRSDSRHASLPFVGQPRRKAPPEPIRFLGVRGTGALLARQDRRMDRSDEDAGRRDPWILRTLSR